MFRAGLFLPSLYNLLSFDKVKSVDVRGYSTAASRLALFMIPPIVNVFTVDVQLQIFYYVVSRETCKKLGVSSDIYGGRTREG